MPLDPYCAILRASLAFCGRTWNHKSRGCHELSRADRWPPQLQNGELLKVAESAAFDVLVTADQNIRYQQNLAAANLRW
jgi:hypothetical protein